MTEDLDISLSTQQMFREGADPLAQRAKANSRQREERTGNGTILTTRAEGDPIPVAPRSFAPLIDGDVGRTPPLVIQVAHGLMQDIVNGRYEAGTWIREQEVAQRFNSSRAPVREALRLIEIDGLVEMVPWRGARVVQLTLEEIDDLFVLVAALMAVVARFAALHADESAIAKFSSLVDAMAATIKNKEPVAAQLQLGFNAASCLGQICKSPRAAWMFRRIGNLAYWHHQALLHADMTFRQRAVDTWKQLAQAVAKRDAKKAEALSHKIVEQSRSFVMNWLRKEQEATTASNGGVTRRPRNARTP